MYEFNNRKHYSNMIIYPPSLTGSVVRADLSTTTVSLNGSISEESSSYFILTAYCFFPMIHQTTDSNNQNSLRAHSTDGADPDSPRFGMTNPQKDSGSTYDIDYRYIDA